MMDARFRVWGYGGRRDDERRVIYSGGSRYEAERRFAGELERLRNGRHGGVTTLEEDGKPLRRTTTPPRLRRLW